MPDGKTKRPGREIPLSEEREKATEGKEAHGAPERAIRHREQKKEQKPQLSRILQGRKKKAIPPPGAKSKLLADIEDVLADGLDAYYQSLTPGQRKAFKSEGERAASAIETLLIKAQVKVVEIVRVIKRWLSLIPGINQFFIEQESKIKADKMMLMHEQQKKEEE